MGSERMAERVHSCVQVDPRAKFGPGKNFLYAAVAVLPAGLPFKKPINGLV